MGPIQHFNAVALKPQHLGHVDDHAAVAHQKFRLGLKLFLHLCKVCRSAALAVIGNDLYKMVLGHGIVDLFQRQMYGLAGNAHLQLWLLPPQHPPQLPCQMVKLFFFIRFEQVVERMHRKGIPHILRRGCHKHDEQLRICGAQLPRRLDAVCAFHADIQKHHLISLARKFLQKIVSAHKPPAKDLFLAKCLFQQLFQPLGIRFLIFHDRCPQLHCCTPCSFHVLMLIL